MDTSTVAFVVLAAALGALAVWQARQRFALQRALNAVEGDDTGIREELVEKSAKLILQRQVVEAQRAEIAALQLRLVQQVKDLMQKTQGLEAAQAKLKVADRQKTRFFHRISNELRTPLTLILHSLQELRRSGIDGEDLTIAQNNSNRLLRSINQLLDFQNLAAGRAGLRGGRVDLSRFLEHCAQYFSKTAVERGIRFTVEMGGAEHCYIVADSDGLEKIVFNYLSNALRHTPEGGAIKLEILREDNWARIIVRDSGPGLNPEDRAQLFSMGSGSGTGLGLALVAELAREMGGQVGATSELGKGAEFWAEFPMVAEREWLDLLIVDDEFSIARNVEANCRSMSDIRTIRTVSDAAAARKILERHRVRVIVSDAMMPGETGPELLSHVAETQPDCLRILMTAHGSKELFQEALVKGRIQGIFYKTAQFAGLAETIAKHLVAHPILAEEAGVFPPIKDWHLADGTGSRQDHRHGSDVNVSQEAIHEGQTVLVADGLADMRRLIAMILRAGGMNVITAADGIEALTLAGRYQPHCIVADWSLPKMSGIELARALKRDKALADVPMIILTPRGEDIPAAAVAEAAACLGKPFDTIELTGLVRNVLALGQLGQKLREIREVVDNARSKVA